MTQWSLKYRLLCCDKFWIIVADPARCSADANPSSFSCSVTEGFKTSFGSNVSSNEWMTNTNVWVDKRDPQLQMTENYLGDLWNLGPTYIGS